MDMKLELACKGGKRSTEAQAPATTRALKAHIGERTSGSLFLDRNGGRTTEPTAWRLVRRLARRAGLPAANRLSPHSLRHSATPPPSTSACRSGTRRTSPATPIPAPPAATTTPATASIATPPMH